LLIFRFLSSIGERPTGGQTGLTRRLSLLAFCLCLVLRSQTPDAGLLSDTRAFAAAHAATGPDRKIEALLKFTADFPESSLIPAANQAILATLIAAFPDQSTRIRKFASTMYRRTPAANRSVAAGFIAIQFLAAGILLEDARTYARRSLDDQTMDSFVREQLAAYENRGQTPPWSRDIEKRFLELRAGRLATLGRIELHLGHTAAAQKLLEEAHAALPGNVAILAALGELAARAGDDVKALEYLVPAHLTGTAPKEAAAALEAIYRKQHGGSLAGLDGLLDDAYRRRFPNPVRVSPYRASTNRSGRTVLAELFTGSGCGPCAAADLAFDAAMLRYPRQDVAVVMYHQHVPRPDPMANPDSVARYREYNAPGVPTYAIDGKTTSDGGPREAAAYIYGRFAPDIERALEMPAEASLKLDASLAGDSVRVTAAVGLANRAAKGLKLRIVLVEKALRFNGENGIRFHPMVARAIAGFDLAGDAPAIAHSFPLDAIGAALKAYLDEYEAAGHRGQPFRFPQKKDQIQRADLAVVAFVQDEATRHVLQAAYVDLAIPLP
jgi:hypothetical protein